MNRWVAQKPIFEMLRGAEFTNKEDGTVLENVIKGVSRGVNIKDILFELPGRWISNVLGCGIQAWKFF